MVTMFEWIVGVLHKLLLFGGDSVVLVNLRTYHGIIDLNKTNFLIV